MMQNSAHKQHMLELLGILMDLRGNNQQSLVSKGGCLLHVQYVGNEDTCMHHVITDGYSMGNVL